MKGTKLLLVHEATITRRRYAEALRATGAIVSEASTAQMALLLIQAESPDLVVTDLDLPDADGFLLLDAVRKLENGAHLAAVALSPDTEDEVRRHALLAGFLLHIVSPTNPDVLAKTLSGLRRLTAPIPVVESAAFKDVAPTAPGGSVVAGEA
jgi:CheY-like chemotaxis protein